MTERPVNHEASRGSLPSHACTPRPHAAWPLATLPKTLFSAHGCRSRIHRMRFAGNTLEASCCRTCRCRCVARRLWRLLAAADHASLLTRATRVSAPARHAPRRAPTAEPRPPRAAARLPARPCGARPRELIICHIIHIIYYTSVVQSYIYFICYSSLNSTTFKRSSAAIFAQNSLTNGTGQHKRQFLNSLEHEMQCRRATTA